MKSQDVKKIIAKFPDAPGVYLFKRGAKILYVGKATSLKDRVRSYFRDDIVKTRGQLIVKMLEKFDNLEYEKTDSVLEALILEAFLIKKYQPVANTAEKDDKSFNHVVITKEDFPRLLVVRGRELENFIKLTPVKYSFGPFTNGGQLKEALKLVRKIFPYRDRCEPLSGKACFNRQIGLCPGVCTGEICKSDYAKQIRNIILFFEGKKKQLVKNLEKQMKGFAKVREFEKANITKRTLFALNHIQDVSLIKESGRHPDLLDLSLNKNNENVFRIESYDIAHMSGQNVVGVMTVVENGEPKKSDYRKFKINNDPGVNDTKALAEVLSRRLTHIEWQLADLIVIDGGVAQKNVAEKTLQQNNLQIPVVSVVKDERHQPKEILGDKRLLKYEKDILLANAEAHRFAIGYHKKLRRRIF